MTEESTIDRPVETTITSIRILEQLKAANGMTLDDLDRELDYARSTIHRHLLTLKDHDFINRTDGRYHIGLRFFDFGVHARNRLPIFEVAKDQVDKLAKQTGEIVWLIGRDGDFTIFLYKAGERPPEVHTRLGKRRHLHQLAGGKVILAHLPESERRGIIERRGLPNRTENTVTNSEKLTEELDTIRDRGYAFNQKESIMAMNAVAAPIRDETGYPLASISISGPARRMEGEYLNEELANELLASTDTIHIHLRHED